MNRNENRQRLKNEALNKIRKIYNDKYPIIYDQYDSRSMSEQRESAIRSIIEELNIDLSKV